MQEDLAPEANGAKSVSKMAVSADYIQKCKSSFPNVLMAIRELLDNMLAPDKERNHPDAEGGVCLGGGEDSLGEPHDQLRMSGNGQPIPPEKVEDMLNLGHRSYFHQPKRAGGSLASLNAAMDASSTAAGEKVYGLFGHGSFLAVGALSYNAFWQCNHVDAQGKRTRWIALFGQAIVSDNQISHVVLSVPDGVSSEEEWRATCTTAEQLAELDAKLNIMTQRGGSKRDGLDIEYYSLFNDAKELLEAFDEMGSKGETLRLDMLLASDTSPGRLKLQVHEHEMLDIFEENDRRYLRHEMLGWYMPQNDSFALRQHLRPEHLRHNTPLPEITIQEQPLDWLHNDWQRRVDAPGTYIHPVATIQHRTLFGDHDIKVMVMELKYTQFDAYSGLAMYLDSDRAIWAKPILPCEKLRARKEDLMKALSRSAACKIAYRMLLNLLHYQNEEEAVEGGLPTEAEFVGPMANKKGRNQKKDALFRLGGRNVEAYCMVDRRFVTRLSLLADSKNALADTKVVEEMYVLVLRHMARVTWQRYKRETNRPMPSLAQQMEHCTEVSAGLQGLIKEEEEEDEEEEVQQEPRPPLPPVKLKREVLSLLPANGSASAIIMNGPRKRCKQEPGVPPAVSSHTAATAAQHPADDAHVGSAQDPVQGNGSSSAAVGEASHAAGGASSVGGSGAGPGSKSKRRGGLPEADAHELAQLKTAMVRLEKSMKEACKKPEEDKVKLEKQEASTLKKIKSICEGRLKKLGQK